MSAALFIVGGLVLLGSGSKRKASSTSTSSSSSPTKTPASKAAVIAAGNALGLGEQWINWLVWVSKGESGWRTSAWNDSPKERGYAGDAHDRLVSEGRFPCPADRAKWAIGSGGLYGQLAPFTAYFLAQAGAPRELACDPHAAWSDVVVSTVAHLAQVDGTINIVRSKAPEACETFMALRRLYGWPKADPCAAISDAARRAKYSATLKAAGIDPAFLDVKIPNLPEPSLPWGN